MSNTIKDKDMLPFALARSIVIRLRMLYRMKAKRQGHHIFIIDQKIVDKSTYKGHSRHTI